MDILAILGRYFGLCYLKVASRFLDSVITVTSMLSRQRAPSKLTEGHLPSVHAPLAPSALIAHCSRWMFGHHEDDSADCAGAV